MAFTIPASFRVIGPAGDPSGSAEFSPRHSIGGADNVDGYDETRALLDNATWSYVVCAREILAQTLSQGTSTYPGKVFSTSSALLVDACTLIVDLSERRRGIEVFVDFGHDTGGAASAQLAATVKRRDTAAILASGSTTTSAARATASINLAGLSVQECYVEIQLLAAGGGEATLYGVQIYSDEATP